MLCRLRRALGRTLRSALGRALCFFLQLCFQRFRNLRFVAEQLVERLLARFSVCGQTVALLKRLDRFNGLFAVYAVDVVCIQIAEIDKLLLQHLDVTSFCSFEQHVMLCVAAVQKQLRLLADNAVLLEPVLPLEQQHRVFRGISEIIGRFLDLEVSEFHQTLLQFCDVFALIMLFQRRVGGFLRVFGRCVRIVLGRRILRPFRVVCALRINRFLLQRTVRLRRTQQSGNLRSRFGSVPRFSRTAAGGNADNNRNDDQQKSDAENQHRQNRSFLRDAQAAPISNDVRNRQFLLFHTESVSLFYEIRKHYISMFNKISYLCCISVASYCSSAVCRSYQ